MPQEPEEEAGGDAPEAPERAGPLRPLDEPAHELREAGVLDVEAAALAAVELVRDVECTRDHRPAVRVERPVGAEREGEQVAVAAEPRAEPRAQPGEGGTALEQQIRRPERAGGEDEPIAGQLALGADARVRVSILRPSSATSCST